MHSLTDSSPSSQADASNCLLLYLEPPVTHSTLNSLEKKRKLCGVCELHQQFPSSFFLPSFSSLAPSLSLSFPFSLLLVNSWASGPTNFVKSYVIRVSFHCWWLFICRLPWKRQKISSLAFEWQGRWVTVEFEVRVREKKRTGQSSKSRFDLSLSWSTKWGKEEDLFILRVHGVESGPIYPVSSPVHCVHPLFYFMFEPLFYCSFSSCGSCSFFPRVCPMVAVVRLNKHTLFSFALELSIQSSRFSVN